MDEFNELGQSLLEDVVRGFEGDSGKALSALKGIREMTVAEEREKISEITSIFPDLLGDEEYVKGKLVQGGWDVDGCLGVFLERSVEVKRELIRERIEKRKKKLVGEDCNFEYLLNKFKSLSSEEVQTILDLNEGDIESTVDEILRNFARNTNNNNNNNNAVDSSVSDLNSVDGHSIRDDFVDVGVGIQNDVIEERLMILESLCVRFECLEEDEVKTVLEECSWNVEESIYKLGSMSEDRLVKGLSLLFTGVPESIVRRALLENSWDRKKAARKLALGEYQVSEKEVDLKESVMQMKKNVDEEVQEKGLALRTGTDGKNKREKFRENLQEIVATQARHGASPGINPPPLPKEIDARLKEMRDKPSVPFDDEKDEEEKSLKEPHKVVDEVNDGKKSEAGRRVSLKASPEIVDQGREIFVDFEVLEGESNSWDWIGLFPVDKPNAQYCTYQWRGKDPLKGRLIFNAPKVYGLYEFRYLLNGRYEHIAISNKITVGPQYDLHVKRTENVLSVKCEQLSGNKYRSAWVGLHDCSQPENKHYLAWESINKANIEFDLPVKPGQYEIRVCPSSYKDVARSQPFAVYGEDKVNVEVKEDQIHVTFSIVTVDPYVDSPWFGIYLQTEDNLRLWRRYKYIYKEVGATRQGKITFKSPRTPGLYDVRLLGNGSYEKVLAKTEGFRIHGHD